MALPTDRMLIWQGASLLDGSLTRSEAKQERLLMRRQVT